MSYYCKNKRYFRTYADLERLFKTCRSPAKGKPLSTWCRLHKDGNDFYLSFNGFRFAKITPDDVFEFLITSQEGIAMSITLSASLHYCTPMLWKRASRGRYKVVHEIQYKSAFQKVGETIYQAQNRTFVDLFQGIQFCLKTGKCLNPRPDLLSTVNTDVRKVWLRKVKTFKRGLRVRVKIGVFDTIAKNLLEEKGSGWYDRVEWTSEPWINELYNAIENEQYPTELLREIVISSMTRWRPMAPSHTALLHNIDLILNNTSIQLRQKFGVFQSVEGEAA